MACMKNMYYMCALAGNIVPRGFALHNHGSAAWAESLIEQRYGGHTGSGAQHGTDPEGGPADWRGHRG